VSSELECNTFCDLIIQAYHQYGVGSRPGFVNYKKGALDSQPQVIKFTSCMPSVFDIGEIVDDQY
jgi:hypothetical protein